MTDPYFHRLRDEQTDQSAAIPVRVVEFDLSGEPVVTVIPLDETGTLSIEKIPYQFASSGAFAMFIPPYIGMEGYLISTNKEVADNSTARLHDRASGVFVPSGMSPLTSGTTFKGNAGWAEMRSAACRVALSADTVHLEAGETSIVLNSSGADIIINGKSIIAALKEMSTHIRLLEALVHPNGMPHTGAKPRIVDTFKQQTTPTRTEKGVR